MLKRLLLALFVILSFAQPANANWWAMQRSGYGGGSACDANTVLRINSDSTDGSTVFQDTSTLANSITANGNVHHETDQTKAGYGATSIYFDGTGDNLQIAGSDSTWAFGTGNFTIDLWVRIAGNLAIIGNGYNLANKWHLRQAGTGNLAFTYAVGSEIAFTGAAAVNTWTHIAIERHGNNLNCFLNGVKDGTVGNVAGVDFSALADLYIGNGFGGPNDFSGYMQEIRISDIARYSGNNFTPEPGPYCQ